MLTIYLRKETTTDTTTLALNPKTKRQDAVAYADNKCTKRVGRWSWFCSSKPTRRNKTATLNCFKYSLTWVN